MIMNRYFLTSTPFTKWLRCIEDDKFVRVWIYNDGKKKYILSDAHAHFIKKWKRAINSDEYIAALKRCHDRPHPCALTVEEITEEKAFALLI